MYSWNKIRKAESKIRAFLSSVDSESENVEEDDKKFVQRGSYTDYFAEKLAALKAKGKFTDVPAWTVATPTSKTPGLGASTTTQEEKEGPINSNSIESCDASEIAPSKDKSKKKKKKKSKDNEDPKVTYDDKLTQENTQDKLESETSCDNTHLKKKKKKQKQETDDMETEEAIISLNEKSNKKKKKKKEKEKEYEHLEPADETSKKKKSKKSKKEKVIENEELMPSIDNDSGCENDVNKIKKSKKGKKDKVKEKKPTFSDEEKENLKNLKRKAEDLQEDLINSESKKTKKSKRPKCSEIAHPDVFQGSNLLSITGYGVKKKDQ